MFDFRIPLARYRPADRALRRRPHADEFVTARSRISTEAPARSSRFQRQRDQYRRRRHCRAEHRPRSARTLQSSLTDRRGRGAGTTEGSARSRKRIEELAGLEPLAADDPKKSRRSETFSTHHASCPTGTGRLPASARSRDRRSSRRTSCAIHAQTFVMRRLCQGVC